MDNVKFIEGDKLTIELIGRVDSTNAGEIQKIVEEKIAESVYSGIIVDADALEYISSAGLRILLSVKKKVADLTMVNVSREVYDILEVTGFVDLFEVKKALRKISLDNLEMIGQGSCGKVYRIDAETIVKVFNPGFDANIIERERASAQKAFLNGIETAISFDMVRVGDQVGLVYELLEADTFRNVMTKNPEKIEDFIEIYASFLKTMHGSKFEKGALDESKPRWIAFVDYIDAFNDEEKVAVKEMLKAIPDRDTFIHGDYNPGNVMYLDGKAMLIDMASVSLGHPIFDLAGVYLAFNLLPKIIPEEHSIPMTGFSRKVNLNMWNKFCQVYFEVNSEEEIKDINSQLEPFAAFRVVMAATRVDVFPEAMISYCKNLVVNALKDGNHLLRF